MLRKGKQLVSKYTVTTDKTKYTFKNNKLSVLLSTQELFIGIYMLTIYSHN